MVDKTIITAREFLELPETNVLSELIEGEIIVAPSPEDPHQKASGKSHIYLDQLISDGELRYVPADVYLDEITVVQPELFWVSPNSICHLVNGKYWRGAPELVIEILSPGTARRDRGIKFDLYEKHGVREYWLMEPFETYFEVYARQSDKLMRVGLFVSGDKFVSMVLGGKEVIVNYLFGIPTEPTL